ncbi:uncharacterized protein LOC122857463 [Aphidius gifuensis]|uniref:uncharacterized protein LOC122857463 n=1 Tax=Aphidius gifuensis TaxID=684658 RepID=UPI001CDB694A|nr:uncharacterized protein LOC122857463 [Aphidius gifuensis]XP_044015572.1 uncharacterized protein LOC122857463 [Aphidius gifuensis]XP_044015573.1 uncharacterized protein LOC122857463 [Aphidius gifuensis]
MVRKCIVLNCQSSKGNKNNISLFHVPKDPQLFDAWKSNLPMLRKPLSVLSLVCEKHFHPSDVLSQYTQKLPSETWIYPRSKKGLKPKAVPISSDVCSTPDNTILQVDNETRKANDEVPNESNIDAPIDSYVHASIDSDVNVPDEHEFYVPIQCNVHEQIDSDVHVPDEHEFDVPMQCYVHEQIDSDVHAPTKSSLHTIHASTQTVDHEDMEIQELPTEHCKVPFTFDSLLNNLNNIKYPGNCDWAHTVAPDKKTVIFVSVPTDNILRRVEIYDNLNSRVLMEFVHVHQDYLQHNFKNMSQVVDYLTTIYNWKLCATLKDTGRFVFDTVCEGIVSCCIKQGIGRPRLRCMSCVIKLESKKYRKPPPTTTVKKVLKKKILQQKVI